MGDETQTTEELEAQCINEKSRSARINRGIEFEKFIRDDFLKKLKFNDINGGQAFVVGGHQIDAVAGFNSTLLVFECVWTQQRKPESRIRDEIFNFRGKIRDIKLGFAKLAVYEKYEDFRFILVTNIHCSRELIEHAKENSIVLLDQSGAIDYYNGLYELIGDYAKFSFIGEFDIKPPKMEKLFAPCFMRIHGPYRTYLFFISAKKLLERAFVARRETGKEEYYQRFLELNRINEISKYVDEEDGFFPNDIILAFCGKERPRFIKAIMRPDRLVEGWEFPYGQQSGILEFPQNYLTCAVIDGQHRLFAFARTKKDLILPVFAFDDLDYAEQSKIFIDINGKQVKVDSNLIWELHGEFRPDSDEGRIALTVLKLNEREPFKNQIKLYLGKKRGKLGLAEICNVLKRVRLTQQRTISMMYRKNPCNPCYDRLPTSNIEKASRIISNYFIALKNVFSEDFYNSFVFQKNGVIIFIEILEKIVALLQKAPSDEDIIGYMKPLSVYVNQKYKSTEEIERLASDCNSYKGRHSVYTEFAEAIKEQHPDFDPHLKIVPLTEKIVPLERGLAKIVYKSIEKKEINIPEDMEKRVKSRMKEGEEFHERLTLGECIHLIRNNADKFDKIFISKFAFPNRESYLGALNHINEVRIDSSAHKKESFNKAQFENNFRFISAIISKNVL